MNQSAQNLRMNYQQEKEFEQQLAVFDSLELEAFMNPMFYFVRGNQIKFDKFEEGHSTQACRQVRKMGQNLLKIITQKLQMKQIDSSEKQQKSKQQQIPHRDSFQQDQKQREVDFIRFASSLSKTYGLGRNQLYGVFGIYAQESLLDMRSLVSVEWMISRSLHRHFSELQLEQLAQLRLHKENTEIESGKTADEDTFIFVNEKQSKEVEKVDEVSEHKQSVIQWMRQVTYPQTQLSFVQQHLQGVKYTAKPQEETDSEGYWHCEATVQINTQEGNKINEERQSQLPQQKPQEFRYSETCKGRSTNKKMAKQLACTELLLRVYIQNPDIFKMFQFIREQKKLALATTNKKSPEEQQIISNADEYTVLPSKLQFLKKPTIDQMQEEIKRCSGKAEINFLIQQFTGKIVNPKPTRHQIKNEWKVEVRVIYHNGDEPTPEYKKECINTNAKAAEEQASKQVIMDLYKSNMDLYDKVKWIKKAKNISTVSRKEEKK